jgi:hypothetical protein
MTRKTDPRARGAARTKGQEIVEDLRELADDLLEKAEDRLDIEAARVALAESDERIPYEEFRQRQELSDEPRPKTRRSTTRTGTDSL